MANLPLISSEFMDDAVEGVQTVGRGLNAAAEWAGMITPSEPSGGLKPEEIDWFLKEEQKLDRARQKLPEDHPLFTSDYVKNLESHLSGLRTAGAIPSRRLKDVEREGPLHSFSAGARHHADQLSGGVGYYGVKGINALNELFGRPPVVQSEDLDAVYSEKVARDAIENRPHEIVHPRSTAGGELAMAAGAGFATKAAPMMVEGAILGAADPESNPITGAVTGGMASQVGRLIAGTDRAASRAEEMGGVQLPSQIEDNRGMNRWLDQVTEAVGANTFLEKFSRQAMNNKNAQMTTDQAKVLLKDVVGVDLKGFERLTGKAREKVTERLNGLYDELRDRVGGNVIRVDDEFQKALLDWKATHGRNLKKGLKKAKRVIDEELDVINNANANGGMTLDDLLNRHTNFADEIRLSKKKKQAAAYRALRSVYDEWLSRQAGVPVSEMVGIREAYTTGKSVLGMVNVSTGHVRPKQAINKLETKGRETTSSSPLLESAQWTAEKKLKIPEPGIIRNMMTLPIIWMPPAHRFMNRPAGMLGPAKIPFTHAAAESMREDEEKPYYGSE